MLNMPSAPTLSISIYGVRKTRQKAATNVDTCRLIAIHKQRLIEIANTSSEAGIYVFIGSSLHTEYRDNPAYTMFV